MAVVRGYALEVWVADSVQQEVNAGVQTGNTKAGKKASKNAKKTKKGVQEEVTAKPSSVKQMPVYMFGFAASFADSTAYMTDLQAVDAFLLSNGFLADRSLYSLQFNNYLVAKLRCENMTCAVFFNKSKSKMEKKFQKVRKKYRENEAVVLKPVGVDEFKFQTEEYVEPSPTEDQPKVTANQEKKTKKSKKKSGSTKSSHGKSKTAKSIKPAK